MGSLGTGEILVIVLVALIVFGPERLPEITRKAGELLAQARQMSKSVTDSLDSEYKDVVAPIQDLKAEYDSAMTDLKTAVSSVPDISVELPEIELGPSKKEDRPSEIAKVEEDDDQLPSGDEA